MEEKAAKAESRQHLADIPLRNRTTASQAIRRWLVYQLRFVVFSIAPLRRLVEKKRMTPEESKAHWDALMSQTKFSTYLGATINVDGANAMTALLLKYHAADRPSILDIGCSGGTLIQAVNSFEKYLGMDVSSVAIDAARQMVAEAFPDRLDKISFVTEDLRLFKPPSTYDVIVFNEVLYYLNTEQALDVVCQYAKSLNDNGLIIVSMKDDGKSSAIFNLLSGKFDWVDGILWQRKATSYDYAIRPNRERPAFLTGALRKPS